MRTILGVIFALAFASSASAQELDGIALGMTKAQALQVLGSGASETVISDGIRLDWAHPDGSKTTVGICTVDHSNQVNSVNHFQPGSIDDFGRRLDELSAGLGAPRLGVDPIQPGQPRRILAVWSNEGVVWSLQLWGPNTGIALGQFIYKPCGAAG